MIKSLFDPIFSTCICNNCDPNQSTGSNSLYLTHMAHHQTHNLCSPILIFNLKHFLSQPLTIQKANLLLPIQSLSNCSYHLPNTLILSIFALKDMPKVICRDILSNSMLKIKIPITRDTFMHKQFTIDITSFIPVWLEYPLFNYGFMISVTNPDFQIEFYNSSYINSPKLKIEYENVSSPAHDHFPAIQLLSTEQACHCLNAFEPIMFDKVKESKPYNIMYHSQTGQFSFKTVGYYYLQWIINLSGTGAMDYISIGLAHIGNEPVFNFYSPLMQPGEVCGHYILEVKDIGNSYSLINSSKGKIQLSDAPIQASLIIYKICS